MKVKSRSEADKELQKVEPVRLSLLTIATPCATVPPDESRARRRDRCYALPHSCQDSSALSGTHWPLPL